ncbi:MAG: tyrosine-protein phosphatase [Sinobacteraceae bacterium]|nr:tyrosine-protein phosphatase [Nevskiaceae bacterium]
MLDRAPTEAALRCFLGVDWDPLRAMLAAIRDQHRSAEGYIAAFLDIDAATVHNIRSRLLV